MLTNLEKIDLLDLSKKLNVKYNDLYNLIKFESKFNPIAKNPFSSAQGLIQFVDKTSQNLGYKNSLHLVTVNNTISKQLKGPVYQYLKKYMPFKNKQSLYLSVFYPNYRNVSPYKLFPYSVRKVNPGINRPIDYINKIDGINLLLPIPLFILLGVGYIIYKKSLN